MWLMVSTPTSVKAAKTFSIVFVRAHRFPPALFVIAMPIIFIATAIKPSVKDAFVSIPYAHPAKFPLINNKPIRKWLKKSDLFFM
jgi:hypothetical protein